MAQTTITEALADLKTIAKRLETKRQYVQNYLFRQDNLRDPHEKDGGSRVVIEKERQAIGDLEKRVVAIRGAISQANREKKISIDGDTRSIQDWLVWRREVAPSQKQFLQRLAGSIRHAREECQKKGLNFAASGGDGKATDVIVNVDEAALAGEIERMETVLGNLDGQLSLKNATITIDV